MEQRGLAACDRRNFALPSGQTLDEFEFRFQPSVNQRLVRELHHLHEPPTRPQGHLRVYAHWVQDGSTVKVDLLDDAQQCQTVQAHVGE
jgi:hypothetical protein